MDGLERDLVFERRTDVVRVALILGWLAEVTEVRVDETARTSGASWVRARRCTRSACKGVRRAIRVGRRRDDLIGSLERIRRASLLRGVRGRLDEEFARVDGNLLCWVTTLLESIVDPTDRSIGVTGHENFGEMRQVRLLI